MEIQQAKVVHAISIELTMLGAASRLGITQPAVSASLGALERELGVSLFTRSRKGLSITTHGVALLPKIRQMLELNESVSRYGEQLPTDEGELRIAGRQGFMQYVFPILLKQLRKKYPHITVEYALSGDQVEVIDALRVGAVDLAFAASPKIKSISAEVFYHDPVWLAVSPRHPLAKKRQISKSDLASVPLCLPSKSDRLRKPIDQLLRKSGATKVLIETNDYTLMKNIILSEGCGGFIYAHMLAANISELHPLQLSGFELTRDLTVLHRRDDLSPHAQTARDIMLRDAKDLLDGVLKRIRRSH